MAYIGAQPNKQLTKTTSQSFNGTGSATAFTLNRAVNTGEELEVFVDNVQQEPGSGKSYTATGTTLTFDEAPPSGTGNVYVIYRGQAEVTTRLEAPDLSITTAKLAADAVATAKIANSAVDLTSKVTGTLPVANGGTGLTSGFFNGISHFDMYHMDTAEAITTSFEYLNHWASFDGVKNFNRIGAAMTPTSQTYFAFPVTGTWKIVSNLAVHTSTDLRYFQHEIRLSTDSANSYDAFDQYDAIPYLQSGVTYAQSYRERYINVTDTSTFRVAIGVVASGNCNIQGNNTTSKHLSLLSFMRIGDAQ
jgi:hypothetical protein